MTTTKNCALFFCFKGQQWQPRQWTVNTHTMRSQKYENLLRIARFLVAYFAGVLHVRRLHRFLSYVSSKMNNSQFNKRLWIDFAEVKPYCILCSFALTSIVRPRKWFVLPCLHRYMCDVTFCLRFVGKTNKNTTTLWIIASCCIENYVSAHSAHILIWEMRKIASNVVRWIVCCRRSANSPFK